jgi:hypothetical protein
VAKAKQLLVGSHRSSSGKSATILGIALNLQAQGFTIAYGKPLGTFTSQTLPDFAEPLEADVAFITQTLGLTKELICPTLVNLDKIPSNSDCWEWIAVTTGQNSDATYPTPTPI